jgi:FkbM family methyltransferase
MSPNQPIFTEEDKPFLFTLTNKTTVCCNRTDMIHFQEALEGFSKSFEPYLNKEMWAMDIGSACGDSTIVMAGLLGDFPDSRILVFEPSREIYPSLMSNLSKNPITRFDVHTVAAGDSNQMIDFVYGFGNGGLLIPSLIPERGPCVPMYQVQVVNTYQYLRSNYSLEELDKIGFIKIDTEGYDYIVLRGLAPLIFRNRMPIMVEWWNDPSNSNRMFDVIDSLYYEAFNSLGERVTRFDFNSPKRTQDVIIKPI